MKEKIIQILVSPGDGEETTDMVYALTDGGNVVLGEWHPHPDDKDLAPDKEPTKPPVFAWDVERLPPLPEVSTDE